MEPRSDEKGNGSVGATTGPLLEVLSGGQPGGLSVYEAQEHLGLQVLLRKPTLIAGLAS
jgi:hypothetical protein